MDGCTLVQSGLEEALHYISCVFRVCVCSSLRVCTCVRNNIAYRAACCKLLSMSPLFHRLFTGHSNVGWLSGRTYASPIRFGGSTTLHFQCIPCVYINYSCTCTCVSGWALNDVYTLTIGIVMSDLLLGRWHSLIITIAVLVIFVVVTRYIIASSNQPPQSIIIVIS